MDVQLNKKVILISTAVAVGLLLCVTAFLLIRGVTKLNKSEKLLEGKVTQYKAFESINPFPSEKNLAIETKNVTAAEDAFAKLQAAAREGQIVSTEKKPPKFMRAREVIHKALEKKAKDNSVEWPKDFAFGFEWYFVQAEPPEKPEDVSILMEQMMITSNLCSVLFEEKIKSIISVKREPFEVQGRAGAMGMGMGGGLPTAGAARGHSREKSQERPGELKKGDLYATHKFTLTFEAREEALWRILNRFALNSLFIVVTSLKVDTQYTSDKFHFAIPTSEQIEAMRKSSPGGKLYREMREIAGPRFSEPMMITMTVEVCKFPESAKE